MNGFEIKNGILIKYSGDSNQKNIVIPDCVSVIGDGAFSGNCDIETVKISENTEKICEGAFENCNNLKRIEFPTTLKDLAASCFTSCNSLESIELPSGITKIGAGTFAFCRNLKRVSIPDTVRTIGFLAFACCELLEEIKLPKALIEINRAAFMECKGLKKIEIPKSTTKISKNVFTKCIKLEYVSVDAENTTFRSVDGVLFSHDKKELIYYPENKKDKYFKVPKQTKKILPFSIHNQNLSELELPDTVKQVESSAISLSSEAITVLQGKPDDISNFSIKGPVCFNEKNFEGVFFHPIYFGGPLNELAKSRANEAVLQFAKSYHHKDFLEIHKHKYVQYIKDNITDFTEKCFYEESLLLFMLQEALISKENIIPLIDYYSKEKKNEIVSILLEYSQNSNGDDFEYLD